MQLAFSAGSHPSGVIHPLALAVLRERGCATAQLRSKSWEIFAACDAVAMDAVITVCDNAVCELAPRWPSRPAIAHWGLPDPSLATGAGATRLAAFGSTADQLVARIKDLLLASPERLDPTRLRHALLRVHERCTTA